jgi:uncharacterized membrane protein
MPTNVDRRPVVTAGVLIGVGMGGFVDGILFHQILQVHSMLSARLPKSSVANVEINMFWDGLFHVFTWATTALGIALLWRAASRAPLAGSGRTFVGALAFGWGTFNLAEGLIAHHWLQVHHVYERAGGVSVWDWAFLGSGVALAAAGWLLVKTPRQLPVPANDTDPGDDLRRERAS